MLDKNVRVTDKCRTPEYAGLTGVVVDWDNWDKCWIVDLDREYRESDGVWVISLGLKDYEMEVIG